MTKLRGSFKGGKKKKKNDPPCAAICLIVEQFITEFEVACRRCKPKLGNINQPLTNF
jgi:hypothetical protein